MANGNNWNYSKSWHGNRTASRTSVGVRWRWAADAPRDTSASKSIKPWLLFFHRRDLHVREFPSLQLFAWRCGTQKCRPRTAYDYRDRCSITIALWFEFQMRQALLRRIIEGDRAFWKIFSKSRNTVRWSDALQKNCEKLNIYSQNSGQGQLNDEWFIFSSFLVLEWSSCLPNINYFKWRTAN